MCTTFVTFLHEHTNVDRCITRQIQEICALWGLSPFLYLYLSYWRQTRFSRWAITDTTLLEQNCNISRKFWKHVHFGDWVFVYICTCHIGDNTGFSMWAITDTTFLQQNCSISRNGGVGIVGIECHFAQCHQIGLHMKAWLIVVYPRHFPYCNAKLTFMVKFTFLYSTSLCRARNYGCLCHI